INVCEGLREGCSSRGQVLPYLTAFDLYPAHRTECSRPILPSGIKADESKAVDTHVYISSVDWANGIDRRPLNVTCDRSVGARMIPDRFGNLERSSKKLVRQRIHPYIFHSTSSASELNAAIEIDPQVVVIITALDVET